MTEANQLLRKGVVKIYFEPELEKTGYKKSELRHPISGDEGLSRDDILYLFFDYTTGSEYIDGDEWMIVEYLLPFNIDISDSLKNPDYFTTLSTGERERFWRHREMVRYKRGKIKRLDDALRFIDRKAEELYKALLETSTIQKIKSRKDGIGK